MSSSANEYPISQEHEKDPLVLVHVCAQPSVSWKHSSTSETDKKRYYYGHYYDLDVLVRGRVVSMNSIIVR